MSRHLAPAFIMLLALAPLSARAQVNIDQDKSPAHIFASDCAVCHKTTRGLANGRGSSALTGFLSEHYTSSKEEAASVAAYVLSGGGGVGTPAAVRDQNPDSARSRAATAEAKPDSKPEPKTRRAAKPEEEPVAGAKRRAVRERGKPKEERSASVEPGTPETEKKPPADHRGAAAATHAQQPEQAAPAAPAAPAVAAMSAPPAKPEVNPVSPALSAPAQPQPAGATAPPADNIPD